MSLITLCVRKHTHIHTYIHGLCDPSPNPGQGILHNANTFGKDMNPVILPPRPCVKSCPVGDTGEYQLFSLQMPVNSKTGLTL